MQLPSDRSRQEAEVSRIATCHFVPTFQHFAVSPATIHWDSAEGSDDYTLVKEGSELLHSLAQQRSAHAREAACSTHKSVEVAPDSRRSVVATFAERIALLVVGLYCIALPPCWSMPSCDPEQLENACNPTLVDPSASVSLIWQNANEMNQPYARNVRETGAVVHEQVMSVLRGH